MISKQIRISNETGLHARPATLFVRECGKYTSKVSLEKNDRTVDAMSLLYVMSLGIVKDDEITLHVDGDDEHVALDVLSNILMNMED